MRLRQINLRRVPGIDPPFSLNNLASGVNVIVGPNGSGKTSICHAVGATLWPEQTRYDRAEIETLWEEGSEMLRADVEGNRVSWQRAGADAGPPALPDGHLAPCYTLSIRDLLGEHADTDIDIAGQIRIQMSGGYDLQSVLEQRFRVAPRAGMVTKKALDDSERRLSAERKRMRDLAQDEDRLTSLRAEQDRARKAHSDVQALELAIELADVRARLAAVRAELASMPIGLERITGEETDRVDELTRDLAQANLGVRKCEERIKAAEAQIRDSRMQSEAIDDASAESWRARAKELAELERDLRHASTEAEKARAKLASTRAALGAEPGGDQQPRIELSALSDLEGFLQRRADLHTRRTTLEERLVTLESGAGVEDPGSLARGLDALREWLAAPLPGQRARVPFWVVVLAMISAGIGSIFALGASPWWSLVTGAGAGVLILAGILRFATDDANRERQLHLRRWRETGLEDPPDWSPDSVRKLVRSLETRLARSHVQREREGQRQDLKQQLRAVEVMWEGLEKERESLRNRLGVDLPESDLGALELARRIQSYREALGDHQSSSAASGELASKRDSALEGLNQFLHVQGYDSGGDSAGVVTALENFQGRRASFRAGQAERMRAEAERAEYQTKATVLQLRVTRLYQERGLEDDDRDGLRRYIDMWPTYKERRLDERKLSGRVLEFEHKLAERSDLAGLTAEEAARLKAEAESTARRYEEATNEIGQIQERVQHARNGSQLESAAADHRRAQADLFDEREHALLRTAGRFLIADVEKEHELHSRPVVLRRAMEWFSSFTRNRYELVLTEGADAVFRARDTSTARELSISELSDATRIQLLLAVRLAFATHAERGVQIPLFLDEALSTADPERFRAVAESLMVLASEGRQVFYLTSNPTDAAIWTQIRDSGSKKNNRPNVVDLATARGLQGSVLDPSQLKPPPARVIPEPDGAKAEDYGVRLGVSLPDPFMPVDAVHLFYLLRGDLPLLYRVMCATRVETVGQWLSLSRAGRADRLLSGTVCRRIDTLVDCATAVFEGWVVGRGKPVDREVLEESKAVDGKFLRRLTDVANDLGGDGERYLMVIRDGLDDRTAGFPAESIDKLRSYLEENGFIDARETLGESELSTYVLEAMADHISAGRITHHEVSRRVEEFLALFERSGTVAPVAA